VSREVNLIVDDIVASGRRVVAYMARLDRAAFDRYERTVDAVLRNLEVMGEAAKHIPEAVRKELPDVPWRAMAELRDLLCPLHQSHLPS